MPQVVYDIYVWINIAAFVITLIDKIACGALSNLFWMITMCFGGLGSAIGCHLFRHRTRNGDAGAAVFLALVQFGILYLLERWFG